MSNIMVLYDWVWYNTIKVSKYNYKICYYFMGSSFIFQFLYINVLNYCYFYTDS